METPNEFSLGLQRAPRKQSKSSSRESAKPNTRVLDSNNDSSSDKSIQKYRGRDIKSRKLVDRKSGDNEEWMSTQRVDKRDFIFDLERVATMQSYMHESDKINSVSKQANKRTTDSKIKDLISGISKKNQSTTGYESSSSGESVHFLGVKPSAKQRLKEKSPHGKHKRPQSMKKSDKRHNAPDRQIDDLVSNISKKNRREAAGYESSSSGDSSSDDVQLLRGKKGIRHSLNKQTSTNEHERPQKQLAQKYKSSNICDESSLDEVRVVKDKQREIQPSTTKRTSKSKNRKSLDRQAYSDYKIAKRKAKEAEIPNSITFTSQLRWYKVRIKQKKKWKLNIRPCIALNAEEASRVTKKYKLSPKNGDAIIQFLSFPDVFDIRKSMTNANENYKCVDDTTLFPFNDVDTGKLDEKILDEYAEQQKSKVSKSLFVDAEKLWLVRVFEHAKRVEANSRARACQDRKDEENVSDLNLVIAQDVRFRSTPDNAMEASDDEELGTPRPILEEEDDAQVDEDFLDCPYTQAMNFDPEMNNLDVEVSNEPMRPGDVIEYYSPIFVVGDTRGLRQATVLAIDPKKDVILDLSNAECLPNDTRVKRIRVMDGDELYDHPGIFRPIETFKLVAGRVKGAKSGVMNEAARFGNIFRKNLNKMQAEADADGFAPMDMLRNMSRDKMAKNDGGVASNDIGSKLTSKPSKCSTLSRPHHSTAESFSSGSETSTDEFLHSKPSPRTPKSPKNHPDHSRISSKPSPQSLKRAMNCSDGQNRRTYQMLQLYESSSSSDGSVGETLNELARKKYATSKCTNIGKENINNSSQKNKLVIERIDLSTSLNNPSARGHASASLGASLASSASLGSSLDSSTSSSDESVQVSPSKYRKVVEGDRLKLQETISRRDDLSAKSSPESSSRGSSKKVTVKTPANSSRSSRRSLLSEDDIEDSDDELILSRNKRGKSMKTKGGFRAPRLSEASSNATWTEGKSGLEKSTASRGLMFSRYK